MCKNFFLAEKLFSAEIRKITECHFWADVMLIVREMNLK